MKVAPPDLSGWLVFCENCKEDRHADQHVERDVKNGEMYYEWTYQVCDSPLLTITRANPSERERTTRERD